MSKKSALESPSCTSGVQNVNKMKVVPLLHSEVVEDLLDLFLPSVLFFLPVKLPDVFSLQVIGFCLRDKAIR